MATESGFEASSYSVGSYNGSSMSFIPKCEIRYEGILYHLSIHESTIGLKHGRNIDLPQILPSDKVYECILFRSSDIKSNHAGVSTSPLSASVGRETLMVSKECQDTLAFNNGQYPSRLSAYQSVAAATNEEFKKDVGLSWKSKAKQRELSEFTVNNAIIFIMGEKDIDRYLVLRSRNRHNRLSRPMKFGAETSGDIPQMRGNVGYGIRSGENFWVSNNLRRGYNYDWAKQIAGPRK